MDYQVNLGLRGGIFAVPNEIVDNYLRLSSGLHLKVLLAVLRHPEAPVEAEAIAQALHAPKEDVTDAMGYWAQAGFLCPRDEASAPVAAPATPAPPPVQQAPPAPPAPESTTRQDPVTGQRVTTVRTRGRMTTGEMNALAAKDKAIPPLLQEAQTILGKELTPAETDTLLYLYSYFNLSPQYIYMVLHYCVSLGKGNLRYVERTAASWVDKGIDTPAKAEAYMEQRSHADASAKLIQSAFGIHGRDLSAKECEFASLWLETYGMGIDLVKLAYERTIDNTGKLSFPYIGKILADWHQKGIRTPAQAVEEMGRSAARQKQEVTPSYDMEKIKWMMTHGPVETKGGK